MLKINKQFFYLLLVILIISIPNIVLILFGEDSITVSFLKKIVFFLFSISIIIAPLLFLKPKYYTWLSILLTPIIIFETYNVYTFKGASSIEAIASIFNTNSYETLEFLKSNFIYTFLLFIIFCALFFLSSQIKKDFVLTKKTKLLLGVFIFSVFFSIFLRDYKIAYHAGNKHSIKKNIANSWVLYHVKLNKIFPTDFFIKASKVKKGIKLIKNYKKTIQNFKFNALKKDTLFKQEIYVLVIGETARRDNFSLLGYAKNTNPKLSKLSNLIAFSNVKSAANATTNSLPFILTRATPNNLKPVFNEPSIINGFKESGFKTYWLTNQAAGLDGVFAFYSRLADYYKNIAVSIDVAKFDEDLLPELDVVLADKSTNKKFIIIHTLGSHFRYDFRYPDNFKTFKPILSKTLSLTGNTVKLKKETINSYDNSILYTDFILTEIISKLNKTNSLSYMYYISDHGENLYDDDNNFLMHGFLKPTKYEIEIPLFIWNSDTYTQQYPLKVLQLKRHKNSRISTTNTFHTLLNMANISFKEEKLKHSFANKKFDSLQTRYLLTPDKTVLKLD